MTLREILATPEFKEADKVAHEHAVIIRDILAELNKQHPDYDFWMNMGLTISASYHVPGDS